MQKIQIIGMKKNLDKVLEIIQEKGVMEITEMPLEENLAVEFQTLKGEEEELESHLVAVDSAIKFLSHYAQPGKLGKKIHVSHKKAVEVLNSFDYKSVADRCSVLEEMIKTEKNEISENMPRADHREELAEESIMPVTEPAHLAETKKLAEKDLENLYIVHDALSWKLEREKTVEKAILSEYCFLLTGWVSQKALPELNQKIESIDHSTIEEIHPAKNELPPVKLENSGLFKPFESVTSLYGLPHPSEMDPTPLLASFFIIFFALCLTDSGYGLVLAIITFLVLRFGKLEEGTQKLVKLIMWAGILTFFVSIPFGGYFGMTPAQFPFLANGELFKGQIINPMSGTGAMQFLILAFSLGVIHVLAGIFIGGIWKLKNKRYADALFDHFLWIYLIVAILGFGLASTEQLPVEYAGLFKNLSLVGAAVAVLTQGRNEKNIFAKLAKGVLSLYGLVGYASDILSYSRLMALGLATGVIAFSVNTIAGLAMDIIPYVGIVFAIIILILGHTANIALNTMGAFIHSARLQFVEFFSKFLEGGGREFKPFKKISKYTSVQ